MKDTPYKLSDEALEDLAAIARYSLLNHGEKQADLYRDSLLECCALLAEFPNLGTDVGRILKGARRHTHKEHIIYYRPAASIIEILRILGGEQDPLKQFSEVSDME